LVSIALVGAFTATFIKVRAMIHLRKEYTARAFAHQRKRFDILFKNLQRDSYTYESAGADWNHSTSGHGDGPDSLRIRTIDYHVELAMKYFYAADHPWLPVGPDPPHPE
jgi:hypothetical protein